MPKLSNFSIDSIPTHLLKGCNRAAAKTALPIPQPASKNNPPDFKDSPKISLQNSIIYAKDLKFLIIKYFLQFHHKQKIYQIFSLPVFHL